MLLDPDASVVVPITVDRHNGHSSHETGILAEERIPLYHRLHIDLMNVGRSIGFPSLNQSGISEDLRIGAR